MTLLSSFQAEMKVNRKKGNLRIPWGPIRVQQLQLCRHLREPVCMQLGLRRPGACRGRLRIHASHHGHRWVVHPASSASSGWRGQSLAASEGSLGGTGCPRWWDTSSNASRQTVPWRSHGIWATEGPWWPKNIGKFTFKSTRYKSSRLFRHQTSF